MKRKFNHIEFTNNFDSLNHDVIEIIFSYCYLKSIRLVSKKWFEISKRLFYSHYRINIRNEYQWNYIRLYVKEAKHIKVCSRLPMDLIETTNIESIVTLTGYRMYPNSLKSLIINGFSETKLTIGNLPSSLEYLKLSEYSNDELIELPPKLKYLEFGKFFQKSLPDSITILKLGFFFNNFISEYPSQLVRLEFGNCFNQKILEFPPKLKILIFGNDFNQPLPKLPDSLEFLWFGNNFNQEIEYFPNSLEKLLFGAKFNQNLKNLPGSLIVLRIGENFKRYITFSSKHKDFTIISGVLANVPNHNY